ARLATELGERLPADAPVELLGSSVTPEIVRNLDPGLKATYLEGFSEALSGVFLVAVPVMLLGFALTWLLKEIPLRTSVHDHAEEISGDLAAASAPGTAAPDAFPPEQPLERARP